MGTEAVRFLVLWMAGWVNSRQLEVIDFLREENRALREQLGGRRLRFTDDQRRRLAATGGRIRPKGTCKSKTSDFGFMSAPLCRPKRRAATGSIVRGRFWRQLRQG